MLARPPRLRFGTSEQIVDMNMLLLLLLLLPPQIVDMNMLLLLLLLLPPPPVTSPADLPLFAADPS